MNFRIKLTIFMIVLMSLTIFTQGILNNFQSGRLIEEAARENAINSVLAETDTISGLLQKEKELPDYLSRDPRIIDFINDQASGEKLQVVESLLEEYYKSRSNLEGLLILNSDGIEIATLTSHDEMRGLDLSGRDYHKRTM
ncbi:MAG: hypothetical protein HGA22_01410, partial [Clostridiales bacterium]|nr:hypothetical protein [Clostridiales bacterium]